MKKFHYKSVVRDYENHIDWLNHQGLKGWELIQIHFNPSDPTKDAIFFFKREQA